MNAGPAVTVVIPLYNKAREIDRTLRSVQAQTRSDYQVIVVDDGSDDGGGEAVLALGDPRFRLIRQGNGGVSVARNRGLEEARTELVALLDADDEWHPEFLAVLLELHQRYPEAALCGAGYAMVGSRADRALPPRWRDLPLNPEGGLIEDFMASMEGDCPLCSSSVLGRRRVLLENGGFAVGEALGEDWDMWVRVALNYRIAFCPRTLVTYRLDATNRARHRLRWDGSETALTRTLRGALAGNEALVVDRSSVANCLSHHLRLLARGAIACGHQVRARALLREAYAISPVHGHWRRLWVKSYFGPGLNRVLDGLRDLERSFRHRRRSVRKGCLP